MASWSLDSALLPAGRDMAESEEDATWGHRRVRGDWRTKGCRS